MRDFYDVIVIGGGHAGAEAAWAAAAALTSRLGESSKVALITMDPSKIGVMSCNPAIGGLAKGQMVREIDALGGLMGHAADATGIMFKMLNTSKGAAVRGPRAQCDKYAYAAEVQRLISTRTAIDVIAGTIDDIIVDNGRVVGVMIPSDARAVNADQSQVERNLASIERARPVYPCPSTRRTQDSRPLRAHAVVLTTGTFMRALMHTGERRTEGGRVNEGSAVGISHTLRTLGLELGRLKTGTPPRLARESLDWDNLPAQHGDDPPTPFSDLTQTRRFPCLPQIACRISHTTSQAHEVIRANLHRAPMYAGQIDAECGPRYCPSIEDKIVRFADRSSHHVFLEPESLHTNEIYCNGISTSLPEDVQHQLVHAMPGCEHAVILKYGYAVEYDMVWPHQIDSTCMVKSVAGLFLAGQINGTSGYEEAAGQGLVAGLNAAILAQHTTAAAHASSSVDDVAFIRLKRDQAYIGVMMDDLVTRTPREPYRMFTSRAEHRLLLRADNADERLTPLGRELGLVEDARWSAWQSRHSLLRAIHDRFDQHLIDGKSLREIARRPEVTVDHLTSHFDPSFDRSLIERAMNTAKYDGYIVRQNAQIKRQARAEQQRIPSTIDFASIKGLRAEAADALTRFRPATLGQAGRLAGITPADITLLMIAIHRARGERLPRDTSPTMTQGNAVH